MNLYAQRLAGPDSNGPENQHAAWEPHVPGEVAGKTANPSRERLCSAGSAREEPLRYGWLTRSISRPSVPSRAEKVAPAGSTRNVVTPARR
jgi:hypothetical protein